MKLTEAAINKVLEISEKENLDPIVRAGVAGGGCSGYQFKLFFENQDEVSETDYAFKQDGVKLVVDMLSHQYLENTTIDYVDSLMASGFKFDNPSVTKSCGCGKSFAF